MKTNKCVFYTLVFIARIQRFARDRYAQWAGVKLFDMIVIAWATITVAGCEWTVFSSNGSNGSNEKPISSFTIIYTSSPLDNLPWAKIRADEFKINDKLVIFNRDGEAVAVAVFPLNKINGFYDDSYGDWK